MISIILIFTFFSISNVPIFFPFVLWVINSYSIFNFSFIVESKRQRVSDQAAADYMNNLRIIREGTASSNSAYVREIESMHDDDGDY